MGFTRNDIRACAMCGQGVGVAGPVFYRVRIEQLALDAKAIQREAGLEMMMGGNAAVARALSPAPDFAVTFRETGGLLCGRCALGGHALAVLLDQGESDEEETA